MEHSAPFINASYPCKLMCGLLPVEKGTAVDRGTPVDGSTAVDGGTAVDGTSCGVSGVCVAGTCIVSY